jgi:uncharacterized protein
MMIVDTHMHLYRYPEHYVKEVHFADSPEMLKVSDDKLKPIWDVPPERYLKAAEGVIDKAILVAGVGFGKTEGVEIPNDYVASVVKQYPKMFVGLGSVDPMAGIPAAIKELERCVKELGFIGLKFSTPTQCFHANDPMVYPIYAKAQELGIVLQIHPGYLFSPRTRMKYANVIDIDDVAVDFPELKIHICHLGFYFYTETLALLQKNKNVFADLSVLPALAGLDRQAVAWNRPVIDDNPYYDWLYPLLRAFSTSTGNNPADKLLFATDYPMQNPKQTVEIIKNTSQLLKERNLPVIPRASLDAILNRNWKKIYKF